MRRQAPKGIPNGEKRQDRKLRKGIETYRRRIRAKQARKVRKRALKRAALGTLDDLT